MDNHTAIINRVITGNPRPDDQHALDKWLSLSLENKKEFERQLAIWQQSVRLKIDRDPDVDAAWADFQSKLVALPVPKKQEGLRMAAGFALIAGMAMLLTFVLQLNSDGQKIAVRKNLPTFELLPQITSIPDDFSDSLGTEEENSTIKQGRRPRKSAASLITYATQDSARAFYLPDSSVVFLNDHSRLVFNSEFGRKHRELNLSGEAYFEVAADTLPFTVTCAKTSSKGLRSYFNVREDKTQKSVEVLCVSGSVDFTGLGKQNIKTLTLASGEKGVFNKEEIISKEKNKNKDYKWWQKKNLRASLKSFFKKLKNIFN